MRHLQPPVISCRFAIVTPLNDTSKLILVAIASICLAGCNNPDSTPPAFVAGSSYAVVTTNTMMDGVPRPDLERLYYFPNGAKNQGSLVWPFVTSDDMAAFGQLVVFNGGITSDLVWKFYPALFAYNGAGDVVEISMPACRQIPGWQPNWTNYAFAVVSASNNMLRLDASQRLPADTNRPKRVEVTLDKTEILKAVAAAQHDTNVQSYGGIEFRVAQ